MPGGGETRTCSTYMEDRRYAAAWYGKRLVRHGFASLSSGVLQIFMHFHGAYRDAAVYASNLLAGTQEGDIHRLCWKSPAIAARMKQHRLCWPFALPAAEDGPASHRIPASFTMHEE